MSSSAVMAICLKRWPHYIHKITRTKNIMTTASKCEKAMENLQKNPYFEKYAERIASLQKTSPEEFLKRLEEQEKSREQEKKKKFASVDTRQYSSVLNPKKDVVNKQSVEDKKLDEILKIDLVQDKDASEIQVIWEEYHKNKEVISATIPSPLYREIKERMVENPTFLFPLPREQGYEFIMCQSYGHAVHFTPLLAFQVHKENAPECLTMIHYTELEDKGIVLMRGEYDKNVLNGQEAQCLANQFQIYYNGKDEDKLKLLHSFTKSPDSFKHMDLITELENITLV
ncbi:ATP synthase mitochondrial F1 complex assembly factor 1-like isoform X1 [Zerene cesonia]|uniref:ATP synthase mitochondrial F1 complex assembly factor 1-like isoform X1 n=2 Tax=Zerene cesonia TaxID=33412 RepID=UPI0018E53E11|nr:ATP synthase mitochondrial F1 complex assembly factor 1-like isoform X1 [Zerene cesonia]